MANTKDFLSDGFFLGSLQHLLRETTPSLTLPPKISEANLVSNRILGEAMTFITTIGVGDCVIVAADRATFHVNGSASTRSDLEVKKFVRHREASSRATVSRSS